MEKTTILTKLYSLFGDEIYHNFFHKSLDFLDIKQTVINNYYKFDTIKIKQNFYDSIYTMIFSFKTIYSNNNISSIIFPINKTEEPFYFINNLKEQQGLTEVQKEIYELILNYKIYDNYFESINDEIKKLLFQTSRTFQISMYIYIHLDILILFSISVLIIVYIIFFQKIIVKLINYINYLFTNKNDNFDFNEMLKKKLDNLEIVLQLYGGSPVKAIKNINNIYNKYYKFITKKNKNESKELSKVYTKLDKEKNKKEMLNIPKNQRIVNLKQIRNLNLFNQYIIINFINNYNCFIYFFINNMA